MNEHIFLYGSIVVLLIRGIWEFKRFDGKISPLVIYTFCYFYFCFGFFLLLIYILAKKTAFVNGAFFIFSRIII